MHRASSLCGTLVLATSAFAGPIETDRPDFTESPSTLPVGRWQVESGFTLLRDRSLRSWSLPELLLRTGIGERLELRFGAPDYLLSPSAPEGFSDVSLGLKHALPGRGETDLALLLHTSLPTGKLGESRAVPELFLISSSPLRDGYELSGQIGARFGERLGGMATLSLGIPLRDERWGAFAELAAEFEEDAPPSPLFHTGLTFSPQLDVQFDLHLGFGLNRHAPEFFVGGGYAHRF